MTLVLTLLLDDAATARFDALRREHFPAGRTQVAAHVTLFHVLPDDARVRADVREVADRPAFDVRVSGVQRLGRGVAYALRAPELDAVHRELAGRWQDVLVPQDRQGLRAHVTVQNKVEPARARALAERLEAGFAPYDVRAVGLGLWRYLDGPWAADEHAAFAP